MLLLLMAVVIKLIGKLSIGSESRKVKTILAMSKSERLKKSLEEVANGDQAETGTGEGWLELGDCIAVEWELDIFMERHLVKARLLAAIVKEARLFLM